MFKKQKKNLNLQVPEVNILTKREERDISPLIFNKRN